MALQVHARSDDEQTKIERLTHAQSAPVRLVRRARIIHLALQGLTVPHIAAQLQISEKAVRQWLKRFETAGLDGLEDAPRSGRPHTYRLDGTNWVIAKARSLPPTPEERSQDGEEEAAANVPPTCHWTLDRLQAELAKDGLAIKRSQIRRLLKAEHISGRSPAPG